MSFKMKVLGIASALVISFIVLTAVTRAGLLSPAPVGSIGLENIQQDCTGDIGSSACGGSQNYPCNCASRSHTLRCPDGSTIQRCIYDDYCKQTNCGN
jgi:hypothetical protein